MPSQEYIYLTSTIIKEVARFGGALGGLLHPDVARRVIAKFKSSSS
jgi:phosphopantetheine adenylyltransferase